MELGNLLGVISSVVISSVLFDKMKLELCEKFIVIIFNIVFY